MYRVRRFTKWRLPGQNPSKFSNVKTAGAGGLYHSKLEQRYGAELDLRKRAGDIKEWERQVRISLDVNGAHICNYYIDFVITHNDGTKEYVEVKGFETDTWRLKWKLFEALYQSKPGVRLTIVK